MTVDVLSPKDALPFFEDTMASEAFQQGMKRLTASLELDRAPALIRHALIQYRLYEDAFVPDSAYLSGLSTGHFRVPFTAIPLKQIGIKIDLENLVSGEANEVYLDPLNRRDFVETFSNADRVDFDLDLIGFGIALADMREVIETYYWETRGATINDSIEIREDHRTGLKTPYYRHRLGCAEGIRVPESFNEAESAALSAIAEACTEGVEQGRLDDVFIYSRKTGGRRGPYASYYLTSQPL